MHQRKGLPKIIPSSPANNKTNCIFGIPGNHDSVNKCLVKLQKYIELFEIDDIIYYKLNFIITQNWLPMIDWKNLGR